MDFFELINKRESCRNFNKEKKVETQLLEKCVQWASLAPSACNSQPWSFVAVNEEKTAEKIAESVQGGGFNPYASQAPAFIVVCKEKAKLLDSFEKAGADSNSFRENDLGMALSYLTLAATENGLSSCILGWRDDKLVRAALKLEEKKEIHCVVAIGYSADENPPRKKKRKPLEEIFSVIE